MLKLRALRAFFYASVTLGEHLALIPYLRDRGIVFTMVCEKMVEEGLKHWPGQWDKRAVEVSPHEAELLKLNTDKVHSLIKWRPRWNLEKAVWNTFDWYYRHHQGESAIELMLSRT